MESLVNGLMLKNVQFPVEMLIEIFCRTDRKTLFDLQFVCYRWHEIIKKFVWHKDAIAIFKHRIRFEEDMPWNFYYSMSRIKFEHNLVKNHSGAQGYKYWNLITALKRFGITLRDPPSSTPELPDDPVFEGKNDFFHVGYRIKTQIISLPESGFPTKFLDIMQPPIEVSVWYTGKAQATYNAVMCLYGENDRLVDKLEYCSPDDNIPNKWYKVSKVFENYGPGIKAVRFSDSGNRTSKAAGICVKVMAPGSIPDNYKDAISDVVPDKFE